MDENTNSNNTSNSEKSSTGMIIGVVAAVAIVGLIVLWFINRSSIDQLSRQLAQTQNQVQDVQKEATDAKDESKEAVREGLENVAGAIGDINNPLVRLALTKAYVAKLGASLDAAGKQDLNTIVVYVEKQPAVLVKPQGNCTAYFQQAVTNLKTKLANAKAAAATALADTKAAVQEKINDLTTLTGTLAFVSDDSTLGGSVFVMTTDAGRKYYFEFGQTTSQTIKNTMLGKEVAIKVKVTGIDNGHITYDVISGPTLVTPTPAENSGTQSGTTQ